MKKNQLTTTKSTAVILGKTKSLMKITKKILEGSNKGLVKAEASQDLTTHKDITLIGELMWEKESRKMSWDDAMVYAKKLRLGGYDDWRLPTKEELEEIVTLCGGELTTLSDDDRKFKADRNKKNVLYQKAYKAKGFASDYYWSSTTCVGYASDAWDVYFSYGSQDSYDKRISLYVRCVRAGQ